MDMAKKVPAGRKGPSILRYLLPSLLVVICAAAYDFTRFDNSSGDNISSRYWPISILKYGTTTLNPFKTELDGVGYAALMYSDGRWLPRVDWGIAPLMVPVYYVADAAGIYGDDWTHDKFSRVARMNSIVLAIASVLLLYAFLMKFVSPGVSFLSSGLFAIGTWHWSVGAQGMNHQIAGVFLHTVNLHLLYRFCTEKKPRALTIEAVLLAILHFWIWSSRPSDLYLLIPMGLVILERKRLVAYLVPFLSLCAGLAAFYLSTYGNWMGWRGVLTTGPGRIELFEPNPIPGLLGLLFSPNRGAIVFFPLLLLVPYLWIRFMPRVPLAETFRSLIQFHAPRFKGKPRNGVPENFATVSLLGCALYFLSLMFLTFWHSTWSWGARYLYDFLPYLWLPVTFAIRDLGEAIEGRKFVLPRWALALFAVFAIQGIFIHALGHRNFDIYVWNWRHHGTPRAALWDLSDLMVVETWDAGSNHDRWPDAIGRLKRYGF